MHGIKVSIGVIVAGTLVLLGGQKVWSGEHRTIHFQESGSSTTVPLDLDGDSTSDLSSLGIDSGKSDLGPYTDQTVAEADPDLTGKGCSGPAPFNTLGVPCKLPDGSNGCVFDAVGGSDVFRFSNGDLLFGVNELGTLCLNLSTSASTFSGKGAISGGTGKFFGANGTISFKATGANLNVDNAGHSFGWFAAFGTIELTLP